MADALACRLGDCSCAGAIGRFCEASDPVSCINPPQGEMRLAAATFMASLGKTIGVAAVTLTASTLVVSDNDATGDGICLIGFSLVDAIVWVKGRLRS